ncbi:hypothetical protein R1sor_013476 [Riccia sorocarpa]|uniref:Uncharacterized protein n=1 Tax=Riccia sorocarpa TaxID=122646 RepID=A0ABD3H6P0_9MARC
MEAAVGPPAPPPTPPNNPGNGGGPSDTPPPRPTLVDAIGGMENFKNLMAMMTEMQTKSLETIMGGIYKNISTIVDQRLEAKLPLLGSQLSSQQSPGVGRGGTPQETSATRLSSGREEGGERRPRLQLDKLHEPADQRSINELNSVIRSVYERHLRPWEKWADQITEMKNRMIQEEQEMEEQDDEEERVHEEEELDDEEEVRSRGGSCGSQRTQRLDSDEEEDRNPETRKKAAQTKKLPGEDIAGPSSSGPKRNRK